jgi:hypothetical protein
VLRQQALDLEGELADNEVLTYLQMISPDELRPALRSRAALEVQEVDRTSPLIRRTTVGIGRPHQWPSQGWGDQQWQTYLKRPHLRHWVAFIEAHQQGCSPWTCHRAVRSR